MQFSMDSPSISADCDRSPHSCLAQRVSCGSGRAGQCLSSLTAGTSQPIFLKSLEVGQGGSLCYIGKDKVWISF